MRTKFKCFFPLACLCACLLAHEASAQEAEAVTEEQLLALLDPPDASIIGCTKDRLYLRSDKVHMGEKGPSVQTKNGDFGGLSFDEKTGLFFLRVPSSFSLEGSEAIWDYWRCSNGHLNPPWSVKCGVLQCGERRYGS
jgi:hypothetical protein